MSRSVRFTRQAQKHARKFAAASPSLKAKYEQLLQLLAEDPVRQPPPEKVLVDDLRGAHSRRLNIQHRLVYKVLSDKKLVNVLRIGPPAVMPLHQLMTLSAILLGWNGQAGQGHSTGGIRLSTPR